MIELLPSAGRALVVGGGAVARRKVDLLVEGGFEVDVVAPEVGPELAARQGVTVSRRPFSVSDVAGHAIVFACTDIRSVNAAAGEGARAAGIPVVVADSQGESTCFTPAVHRDGALLVGVATGGASPRLSQEVRDRVASALGPGWAERVEAARVERRALRAQQSGEATR